MRSRPHLCVSLTPSGSRLTIVTVAVGKRRWTPYPFLHTRHVEKEPAMTTLTEERDADVIARSVQPGRFHVLIAGAGPAGVEAALRLQRIAGDRIRTTIVAPDERFVHLPPTVLEPFAVGCADAPPLGALAASAGARLHRGTVVSVDPLAREVHLHDGDTLRYDALLIAVGGRQRSPYPRALAFGTAGSEERMHG